MVLPLLAALVFVKAAPIVVTPDITEGEVISKERTIKVRVQADTLVTQVEMLVGDDLRDNATSTPYTFHIDPLNEKEGPVKLTFTAYTSAGEKGSKAVNVTIDTGAGKGAAANTTIAEDFLTQSKWDDAIQAARVALKADPNYNGARIVLARAFMRKGLYDKSQQFAEDALKAAPNSPSVLELVSAVELRRAFSSYATGDPKSVLNAMGDALKKAIDSHRTVLEEQFDKMPAPATDNLVRYADVAIRTQHYSAVVSALLPTFTTGGFKADLGDRIAYAQLRLGRFDDLTTTLDQMKKAKTLTTYTKAIWSALYAFFGDDANANTLLTDALGDDPDNLGVRTAATYLALRKGNLGQFNQLSSGLAKDQGQLPEVNYYLAVLYNRLREYNESDQAFLATVLSEPLSYFMYIERGNEALGRVSSRKVKTKEQAQTELDLARNMYDAALRAKPDSVEALTAMTILHVLDRKSQESATSADAAVRANGNYAAGRYAAASVFSSLAGQVSEQADVLRHDSATASDPSTRTKISNMDLQSAQFKKRAQDELAMASRLDPKRLQGVSMPSITDAFVYFAAYGALPLITAPR